MNGNVTQHGIEQDIAWMARVGIGGLQNFDAAVNSPQIVEQRLVYMSPEWKAAFHFAAQQAGQKGLELAIASSPGWSETGGPWVAPRDAMKKLVWSSTSVEGGKAVDVVLPPLPSATGPYQDIRLGGSNAALESTAGRKPEFGADALILAYRLPVAAVVVPPQVTVNGTALDAALLSDQRYVAGVAIPRGSTQAPTIIRADFEAPQTIRALTLHIADAVGGFFGSDLAPLLEASDDGDGWRKVAQFTLGAVPTTASFAPVTARHFRITLLRQAGPDPVAMMTSAVPPGVDMASLAQSFGSAASLSIATPGTYTLTECALLPEARVNAFERKAGFAIADDYYALDGDAGPDIAGIDPSQVVDLSARLAADGHLHWSPPPGHWQVIRFGYSLTGKENHPATAEATGLEVDKYDGKAVRHYLETYLNMYGVGPTKAAGAASGIRALLTDSIEVGPSNWTPDFIAQFQRLRGYDPKPWLPALAGVVVGSRSKSDAFLHDFRRTLAELLAEQHYGVVARVAHERGLTVYGEALEGGRPVIGDDIAMRSHADIPMSALWTFSRKAGPGAGYLADMKGAASVAHIYGQNLVAAESMTSVMQPWAYAPRDLRRIIDVEFATGVNRPVVHTSVHQPADDKQPGLALQIFGQYFNRHETWAEMAKPWVDYMARNSLLLQQGRNVADVAYFYGEEAPLTKLYEHGLPTDAPVHYAYDFVNADVVLHQLQVAGRQLVTPGGARYRVLYLGGSSRRMSLPLLRRLAALVEAGATIVGAAPQGSPAMDDPVEVQGLIARLWGDGQGQHAGKGRVLAGGGIEHVLATLGVPADFRLQSDDDGSRVAYVHRRLASGEVYFLSNRTQQVVSGEARFRISGRAPEIWRADTGEIQPVSFRIEGSETVIPLSLAAEDSLFIVFRKVAKSPAMTVRAATWSQAADISAGPWEVSFQAGRGAPARIQLPALASLSEHAEPGIRYFSGVATYRKPFVLPGNVKPGTPLRLDIGQFADMAEIRVNGQEVGTIWREPSTIDIGKAVHAGSNELEIRVADLWVNRLIGDVQPGVTQKVSWTSTKVYLPTAPLRPSGLVGPVTLWKSNAN